MDNEGTVFRPIEPVNTFEGKDFLDVCLAYLYSLYDFHLLSIRNPPPFMPERQGGGGGLHVRM